MYGRARTPPYIDHLFSIKIDNLPYRSNMGDVERYFKKYGKVGDIYIPRDSRTHESRGFAFVRYYDERDAEDAVNSMNGSLMDGREIRVAMARNGRPTNQTDNSRRITSGGSRSFNNRDSGRDYYNKDHRSDRNSSSYTTTRDRYPRDTSHRDTYRDNYRDGYRDRRHSPPRRHNHNRDRSRSHSRTRKKSRSPPAPSPPRFHRRSPSNSPHSRSPQQGFGRGRSRSRSPSLNHI